jgi:hypothetical protein
MYPISGSTEDPPNISMNSHIIDTNLHQNISTENLERSRRLRSLKILMGAPEESNNSNALLAQETKCYIVDSVINLSLTPSTIINQKSVLIESKEVWTALDLENNSILSNQSKAHTFEIPDIYERQILNVTVSIVFQGVFSTTGVYKPGKIGAGLYRLPNPDDHSSSLIPVPVGYCSYVNQSINSGNQLGHICILHNPNNRPLKPGSLQIIIGCGMC